MKEKLLKLVDACIKDTDMIYNKGIDINWKVEDYHLASEALHVTLNNKKVDNKSNYKYDTSHERTYGDGYHIKVNFEKHPPIVLEAKLERKEEVIKKLTGKRNSLFFSIDTIFDVTVVNYIYNYELRCGNYTYIVEKEIVKEFYDKIIAKRKEIADKLELNEINKRLSNYKIK